MSIVKSFSFPEGEIRGDMFYIQHITKNFTVIDCYLKDGNGANCRKDELIEEIVEKSDGRICRFISTHPDNDHILGIESLDERWGILNFYAVANNIPEDKDDASLMKYIQLKKDKNFAISRGITRKWLNESDDTNNSSGLKFEWPLLSNEKFNKALEDVSKGESPNNISCILTYSIQGGAKYMWMGDMETDMQQEYYDCYKGKIPHVNILFQPHHGRKSGSVPAELLNALNPQLIIIGNAPSEYIDYGDSRQTITQNQAGDIIFENEGKEIHVYTKHLINNIPSCLYKKKGRVNKIRFINGKLEIEWFYCGTLAVE